MRIKGSEGDANIVMEAILALEKPCSWKDCLMGTGLWAEGKATTIDSLDKKEDFELLDEDIVRSSISGILTINFFEQVNQILIKDDVHGGN